MSLRFYKEYIAGTYPNDPHSAFVLDVERNPYAYVIRWESATNRQYRVSRSQSLLSGFSTLKSGIEATPPINTYTDTNAVGSGPYFYRINVE